MFLTQVLLISRLKRIFFYGKLYYLLAHALINNTRSKAGERSTPIKATRDDS